ncbi:hypothetical protein Taro_048790 [Colocasia esculenta]|uniref:Uncharacterized protein n=1 Tax=Colocasia esculenta TaxID=4460 RepID=A0A843X942_COLES|nr:hypothetical protein [Colocasia esculenta]
MKVYNKVKVVSGLKYIEQKFDISSIMYASVMELVVLDHHVMRMGETPFSLIGSLYLSILDVHLADDVELPASSDESMEPLSLSKENEMEEVDPQQPEIQLGDSDEEEYTNMVRGRRATSLGGRGEGSGRRFTSFSTPPPPARGPTTSAPLPLAVGPTTSTPLPPTASASPSQMASGSTPPPSKLVHADDETSHHEGEGSYNETMQAVWINEGAAPTTTPAQFREIVNESVSQNISAIVYQTVSQMLAQLGFLGDRAPPA